jgi:hypothetical protein
MKAHRQERKNGMSLIDRLIEAVTQNCDTTNLDLNAAREDVLQLLRGEHEMIYYFVNEATGQGVTLTIERDDRDPAEERFVFPEKAAAHAEQLALHAETVAIAAKEGRLPQ